MWEEDADPVYIVENEGLKQINDREILTETVKKVIKENPKLISDYRKGKEKALEALMGVAMGSTGGKANPVILTEILTEIITRGE